MRFLSLIVLSLLGVACKQPAGGIPNISGSALCLEAPPDAPSLTLCDWVASTDAIIFGRIDAMSWDDESLAGNPPTCEASLPALRIGITVDTLLHGDVPETIDVFAGPSVLSAWTPTPHQVENSETEIEWGPSDETGRPMIVGQSVGLALHSDPTSGRLGPSIEPLFVAEQGEIRFSRQPELCGSEAPVNDRRFENVAALARVFTACGAPTEAAEQRRTEVVSQRSDEQTWTGRCLDDLGFGP